MRIVLPPSETKRHGGAAESRVTWENLAVPELHDVRSALVAEVVKLSSDPKRACAVLGISGKNLDYLEDNRNLLSASVMPALTRYTGVVYDALGLDSLSPAEREWANSRVWVFSALWGPLRGSDLIPRYRLSWDSKLPSPSVKSFWRDHAETIWRGEFTIDLRSVGYRELAPLPEGRGVWLRVVKDIAGKAAVGHANKAAKGRLVRALASSATTLESPDDFVQWGTLHGVDLRPSEAPGELLWVSPG